MENTDFISLTFHLHYQKMSFRLQLFFYKNIGYSKRNHTLVLSLYRFFRWTKNAIISHCFKGGIV